ncbi:MAG TPA: OsmC family protein [Longimicrobiales bacterium]
MADVAVKLSWTGEGLIFRGGREGGPEAVVDGNGKAGPSPMQALLLAAAGCSGADVVDILARMRVPLTGLEVLVEGERVSEHPRRFTTIRLRYLARGVPAEAEERLRRAVQLSHEKYCSVLHTLRPDVVVESDVALQ